MYVYIYIYMYIYIYICMYICTYIIHLSPEKTLPAELEGKNLIWALICKSQT